MTIRPATKDDVEAMVGLFHVIHELHAAAHPNRFPSGVSSETVAAALREWMAAEDARWFVADDGEIAGYVYARLTQRPERFYLKSARICEIEHIAVHPRARRQGIARRLFDAVFSEARQAGTELVQLNLWTFNQEGRHAFERMGFAPLCGVMQRTVPPTAE
jgi:ribosomal protein S18 acetylase RimI-like enzyme